MDAALAAGLAGMVVLLEGLKLARRSRIVPRSHG
jgi:hypothetical protein